MQRVSILVHPRSAVWGRVVGTRQLPPPTPTFILSCVIFSSGVAGPAWTPPWTFILSWGFYGGSRSISDPPADIHFCRMRNLRGQPVYFRPPHRHSFCRVGCFLPHVSVDMSSKEKKRKNSLNIWQCDFPLHESRRSNRFITHPSHLALASQVGMYIVWIQCYNTGLAPSCLTTVSALRTLQ